MKRAYVTTLCNGDGYVPGVEALGKSLAAHGAQAPRVALVTEDVSDEARDRLVSLGWELRDVEPLENPNPKTAQLFERFRGVYTKLRAWELEEFDKVVLMDADTITLQNIDDLFERPHFAAGPDFFMPDRFNSGVMVLDPSKEIFERMLKALWKAPSYDGGDQGFLNIFIPDWYAMPVEHRLPAGYNLHHFIYQFLRGHSHLREELEREAKVVHYTVQKPWLAKATLTGGAEAWWMAYFGDKPGKAAEWKRRWHALEDWTFDHAVEALLR